MNSTWAVVEDFMRENQISVYGAAPAADLDAEPEGRRPADYVPGAKSVLAFAAPVSRGVYRSERWSKELYWREACLYYRHMDLLSSRLAGQIEGAEEVAAMVPACFPINVTAPDSFSGLAGLVKIAEAAGLGRIGRNGMLMHHQYGPRLHLGGLITTAELPKACVGGSSGAVCPDGCSVCMDACPVDALDGSGQVDTVACNKRSSKVPLLGWAMESGVFGMQQINDAARVTVSDDHMIYECIACVAQCAKL